VEQVPDGDKARSRVVKLPVGHDITQPRAFSTKSVNNSVGKVPEFAACPRNAAPSAELTSFYTIVITNTISVPYGTFL
jgi:hypothetical protein